MKKYHQSFSPSRGGKKVPKRLCFNCLTNLNFHNALLDLGCMRQKKKKLTVEKTVWFLGRLWRSAALTSARRKRDDRVSGIIQILSVNDGTANASVQSLPHPAGCNSSRFPEGNPCVRKQNSSFQSSVLNPWTACRKEGPFGNNTGQMRPVPGSLLSQSLESLLMFHSGEPVSTSTLYLSGFKGPLLHRMPHSLFISHAGLQRSNSAAQQRNSS